MTAKQLLFHDDARDKIRRGVEIAIDTVVAQLKPMAKPCVNSQEIAHVASLSANNDRSISELLASAIDKLGREAAVLEGAAILLCEGRLSSLKDLLPLLDEIVKEGRPLLVIAEDLDSDSLAALVINTIRGTLKTRAVEEGIVPGGGVALLRARRALLTLTGSTLDETSGIRLMALGPVAAQRPCFNNHATREPS